MARVPRLTCLLLSSLLAACGAVSGGGGSGGTGAQAAGSAPAKAAAPATSAAPAKGAAQAAPTPAPADSVLAPTRTRAPLVREALPPGLPPLTPMEGAPGEAPYAKADAKVQTCPAQRSDKCNLDYKPVCAEVDTGVRCIRAPCPSSERKTFGSMCKACRDPGVTTFVEGRCPPG